MAENGIVKLKTSDGEVFEVDEAVASQSEFLKNMIEDVGITHPLPLLKVSSSTLAKVIEYCKYHIEKPKKIDGHDQPMILQNEFNAWNVEFVKVDQKTLFNLILASNYMHIESLLTLTCQTLADMVKKMTAEEIRQTFNIKNEFTKEEEEEVLRETQWTANI